MDFWNRVFIASAGHIIAGPVGNVVGLLLYDYFKEKNRPKALSEYGTEAARINCYIACLAKLANIDGKICCDERFYVEQILRKQYRLCDEDYLNLQRIFDDAAHDEAPIDLYVQTYGELIDYSYNEAVAFIESLIAFAHIDDDFSRPEKLAIERAIKLVKLPDNTLEKILLTQNIDENLKSYKVKSYGSGFFVNDNGYLVTNAHVIQKCKTIKVRASEYFYDAKVLMENFDYDLALLKIDKKSLPLNLAKTCAHIGQSIFTFGYPEPELQGYLPKITKGTISSLSGPKDHLNLMQIDAAIQPASSGGPVLDSKTGALLGIVSGAFPKMQMVNYAIKMDVLKLFLESIGDINSTLCYMEEHEKNEFSQIIEVINSSVVQLFCCKR